MKVDPDGFAITVVVPARDEEHSIAELLDSLLAQTYSPQQIIVVDAGSTDATPAIVERYASEGTIVRLVRAGPAYPGTARNVGVANAAASHIAFIDAGTRANLNWLESLVAVVRADPAVDVVFGGYDPVLTSRFEENAALAYVAPRSTSFAGSWRGPVFLSCLIGREAFLETGGFPDFRAAEDLIFMERLVGCDLRLARAPEAVVHWRIAGSVRATYERFANYSYHNLLAGRGKYWHRGILRQYLGVILVIVIGVRLPAALLLLAAWPLARVGRTLWLKRSSFPIDTPLHPRRWYEVFGILMVLDLATFHGTVRFVVARWAARIRGTPAVRPALR